MKVREVGHFFFSFLNKIHFLALPQLDIQTGVSVCVCAQTQTRPVREQYFYV